MVSKGIFLVDKPSSWTSFDVVAKIRGAIRASYAQKGLKPTKRQQKVGHAGTLDPFATGLLVILVGDDCSKAGDFLKLDKVYEATIKLGETSTTGDSEGVMSKVSEKKVELKDVERVLERFVGEISQTPSAYSAIKIGGQRAYDLARQGKVVEVPSRKVNVYDLSLVRYDYPLLKITTHVSSGTYIRTLAEDVGRELGVGGYCLELRRTRIGDMDIKNALTIEQVLEAIDKPDDHDQHDEK